MKKAERVAIGLSVHTGWAASVVAGGSLREPRMEDRCDIQLLDDPERFVFHRAAELSGPVAERSVARAARDAHARATDELRRLAERLREAKREIVGCAIVANRAPMPAKLDEIVGAHPRIHTAEGLFYRDALCSGARALGLTPIVIAPRELDAHAAKTIGVRPSEIARLLIAAGLAVGRPWAKDQKMAALAAWSILGP